MFLPVALASIGIGAALMSGVHALRLPDAPASAPRAATADRVARSSARADNPATPTRASIVDARDLPARDRPTLLRGEPPAPPVAGPSPTILCRVTIDARGRVTEAVVSHPRNELLVHERAALDAVRGYLFAPARQAGAAVPARLEWPVRFTGTRDRDAAPATVRIKGSDTIGGALGPALAEAYARERGGARVLVEAHGSSTGFTGLLDGSADIGASSRPAKPEELRRARSLGLSLHELVIGYDGVSVIVHPRNPIERLTLREVAELFTGRVHDWSELSGAPGPVRLLGRPAYSGTHEYFADTVLQRAGDGDGDSARRRAARSGSRTTRFSEHVEVVERSQDLVRLVAEDPLAIAYVGLGWLDDRVKPLSLSFAQDEPYVAPSAETIRAGAYPVYRPLLLYTKGAPREHVASFIDFIRAPTAHALIEAHGFVPERQRAAPIEHARPPLLDSEDTLDAERVVRVRFARGAAFATHGSDELLALAERVRERPGVELLLIGHADKDEPRASAELAVRRARAVAALLEQHGVARERLRIHNLDPRAHARHKHADERRVDVFTIVR